MTEFRTATTRDLDVLLDWAAKEGWNPGLEDAAAFYAADPDGFFVAVDETDIVAGISVVNHNDRFSFLGLYIVRPEWRGRGIGYGLWQHALAHAGDRIVGLDGVPEQQGNYAASGFVHAGGTVRYSGPITYVQHTDISGAAATDLPALIEREAAASGQHKPAYLTAWFEETATRKTLVLRNGDVLRGFCTVRQCQAGTKIGPLWANGTSEAKSLIEHAASLFDGDIIIDVPATSRDLSALCESLGMTAGFQTARMYRGGFSHKSDTHFAVTSLELG